MIGNIQKTFSITWLAIYSPFPSVEPMMYSKLFSVRPCKCAGIWSSIWEVDCITYLPEIRFTHIYVSCVIAGVGHYYKGAGIKKCYKLCTKSYTRLCYAIAGQRKRLSINLWGKLVADQPFSRSSGCKVRGRISNSTNKSHWRSHSKCWKKHPVECSGTKVSKLDISFISYYYI